ncbi:MAG: RND family transporter [Methanocalculus sp. MSAO_Arc1]|uniref:efflux RND transporter permease subunit n=1 Tax=Methanocalculus TaxID=71151 RepID=UPI000FF11831|nr:MULTISPECIES: hydrophobe/amphiphile efflux-3 (HAE3) family transporter [unclassified Methanocalculus]MCP1661431.1 hydrophobe/amphiphile efflux-3 (HAE3) family protein [Methanocalculus sp. AMF5]RQD80400.1 MAG: RND family transporter [Methanocalculus sp. MSAO_Arc1]
MRIYEKLSEVINSSPALVAAVVVLLLITGLYGMTLTEMETGFETYMDPDTPRYILLDKYMSTFSTDSIMLLVETEDVLNPVILEYTGRLQDDIAEERYVTGVIGITDQFRAANGGELPESIAEVEAAKEHIPADLLERLVPTTSMTIIQVNLEPGVSLDTQFSVVDAIESRISVSDPPPGVSVVQTGNPAFAKQMMDEMGVSMSSLILIAMLLMVAAIGILFSAVRYRLLSVGIVATGLIMTFGFMGITGMKISMVTVAAFPVLIGLGIDYAIQFHSRLDEEVRDKTLPEAVKETMTRSGPSILYAMLATSMGFIAMWTSPLPMIRSFGAVCVVGVICCYIAALIIVPTFATLMKYEPKPKVKKSGPGFGESYNNGLGKTVGVISRYPLLILAACILLAAGGFSVDDRIIVNTDENTFVPPDMPARVQMEKVTRAMGPSDNIPIFVRGDRVSGLDSIMWMHSFQQYQEENNDRITSTRSIADLVLQYNGGVFPETDAELANVLDTIPAASRDRYLSGHSMALIEISTVDMEVDVGMSFINQMYTELEWHQPPPGITTTLTGGWEFFTTLVEEIRETKTTMTVLGFVLIFGFLFMVYRKGRKAATPIIPIVLIVGWNSLIMYSTGIDYTVMTATLGSMTIGIASEYTILISERYYEEREKGVPKLEAIRSSVQKIGTAITISGLTTVFGFSALITSSFGIISNFGVLTVIAVGFALMGAIIVMPAVLSLIGNGIEEKTEEKTTA